jgi:TetR/AcrR family transcriptional regulator of autoinduction and epiphytic fitness
MNAVKSSGSSRRDRARATRARMVAAAYRLFCDQGYMAATMDAIAVEAGVAVQTLYFTFHTKGELLAEVVQVTAAGEPNAPPVMERPWMVEAMSSKNPYRLVALVCEHGVDIYRRMAPLTPAIRGAASLDPEIDELWQGIARQRRSGMSRALETLSRLTPLHPDSLERATDIMFTLNSHETFLELTVGSGWSLEEFKAWLYRTLCEQLLPSTTPARREGPLQAAAQGLSFAALL